MCRCERRIDRKEERRGARRIRRCPRSPPKSLGITVEERRRIEALPRRGDIDPAAVVGEGSPGILERGGADDDASGVELRLRGQFHVVVARRGDHVDTGGDHGCDRVAHGGETFGGTGRGLGLHHDQIGALLPRGDDAVPDRAPEVTGGVAAVVVPVLQGDHLGLVCGTGDAAGVRHRRQDPHHRGAVTLVDAVLDVIAGIAEVLLKLGEEVAAQVGMRQLESRVTVGDDDVRAVGDLPGFAHLRPEEVPLAARHGVDRLGVVGILDRWGNDLGSHSIGDEGKGPKMPRDRTGVRFFGEEEGEVTVQIRNGSRSLPREPPMEFVPFLGRTARKGPCHPKEPCRREIRLEIREIDRITHEEGGTGKGFPRLGQRDLHPLLELDRHDPRLQ